jgi:hypothetical protein
MEQPVILTLDSWTVVATSTTSRGLYRHWDYEPGVMVRSLQRDAQDEVVIAMQRRVPGGWELVARIAPPAWRHVKRWRDANPIMLPHMSPRRG